MYSKPMIHSTAGTAVWVGQLYENTARYLIQKLFSVTLQETKKRICVNKQPIRKKGHTLKNGIVNE